MAGLIERLIRALKDEPPEVKIVEVPAPPLPPEIKIVEVQLPPLPAEIIYVPTNTFKHTHEHTVERIISVPAVLPNEGDTQVEHEHDFGRFKQWVVGGVAVRGRRCKICGYMALEK